MFLGGLTPLKFGKLCCRGFVHITEKGLIEPNSKSLSQGIQLERGPKTHPRSSGGRGASTGFVPKKFRVGGVQRPQSRVRKPLSQ